MTNRVERSVRDANEYNERLYRLAGILSRDWNCVRRNFWLWYNDMGYIMTWREAQSLCERRAAMGDPMPWEAKDD